MDQSLGFEQMESGADELPCARTLGVCATPPPFQMEFDVNPDDPKDEMNPDYHTAFVADSAKESSIVRLVGHNVVDLIEDAALCNEVMDALESPCGDRQLLLQWLCRYELELALRGPCSSRVVQKMLQVSGGSVRDALVACLLPSTSELFESPHGN